MKAGVSQVCITPPVRVDLCGYVEREQPSVGVLDDLYVRGLYLETDEERLLWLNCDLICFSPKRVRLLREVCRIAHGLQPHQVILSATHTHSGPATINLRGCGRIDAEYLVQLDRWLIEAAANAVADPEPVTLYFAESRCRMAIDRRKVSRYKYADDRLPVLAFKNDDGSYLAVLSNYPMHNVALSYENRYVSADVFGNAAEYTRASLPGKPITLLTNGGCANVVPPQKSVDPEYMLGLARLLGDALVQTAEQSETCLSSNLAYYSESIELPLSVPLPDGVLREYERDCLRYDADSPWFAAITEWKEETLQLLDGDHPSNIMIELHLISIGPVTFTAAGAEVFTLFAEELRAAAGPNNYVIGYANGNIGYLPFWNAYKEGGYEVDTAYKFYANFMNAPGGYEIVRDRAMVLLSAVQ